AGMSLDGARASLLPQGFHEVQLGDGDVAFVKGSEESIKRLQEKPQAVRDGSIPQIPRCGVHRGILIASLGDSTPAPTPREDDRPGRADGGPGPPVHDLEGLQPRRLTSPCCNLSTDTARPGQDTDQVAGPDRVDHFLETGSTHQAAAQVSPDDPI